MPTLGTATVAYDVLTWELSAARRLSTEQKKQKDISSKGSNLVIANQSMQLSQARCRTGKKGLIK
jgi:hypothetical protein